MDLLSLRYFRAIAREGSITAAARVLGVSQPTLSVAIRNLEEELATRLVTRTRAGVELTATGVVLLGRADAILAQVDEAADILLDGSQDPGKACDGVSIGVGFEAARVLLGPVGEPVSASPSCL